MEYAGKSHKDKREEEELKLKKQTQGERDTVETAADAWADVLSQIRGVMGEDEATDS